MGMAVGMAIAERHMASVFNKEGYPVVDHYTYALGGDGCMMEGISSEAFSLAGTLKLSKLIIFYDSNRISIEGSTDIAFTENVQKRMEAFGFQTITVEDGNNLEEIGKAIEAAKADTERPSFITVKTQIGFGCPAKQGKASAHGEPLGDDNIKAMKENLGWPSEEPFFVPEEVYDHYKEIVEGLQPAEDAWNKMFAEYCEKYPEMKELWDTYYDEDLAEKVCDDADFWAYDDKADATRNLSGKMINRIKDRMPNVIGGAADLSPSTKTYMKDEGDFSAENYAGRNMHFGVRELAMTAIGNGIMLHGGLRAFVSTFFVFSDYTKPMARLSSIMGVPLTFVFTHDSIGVGEDGPTHEPIEQLAMWRAMPNFHMFRPADATETAAAWYSAITSKRTPTALALTRQNLPQIEVSDIHARLGLEKGKYILLSAHREENIDTEENFCSLFTAVNAMAAQYDMPVLYSCHPRSRKRLEESGFQLDRRVIAHKPLGFHDYNCLQMNAFCVVSDSGTLPEESSFYLSVGKPFPAVCIRTSTERPEALDKGCFVLSGIHTEQLLQSIDLAVQMQQNGDFGAPVPDYTAENVSVKVARIIQSYTGIVDRFVWRK